MKRAYCLCLIIMCLLISGCEIEWTLKPETPYEKGMEGATLAFSYGGYGTAATDDDGRWSKSGLKGRVIVRPAKQGWVFDWIERTLTETSNRADFTGRSISEGTGGVLQAAAGGYHIVALSTFSAVEKTESSSTGQNLLRRYVPNSCRT